MTGTQDNPECDKPLDLDNFKGNMKTTTSITLEPFEMVHISGLSTVKCCCKRVNVMVESKAQPKSDTKYISVNSYTLLKPGPTKVSVGLRNLSTWSITILAKSVVAKLSAANKVPDLLASKFKEGEGESKEESMDSDKTSSDDTIQSKSLNITNTTGTAPD